jgi:hypothetical protein
LFNKYFAILLLFLSGSAIAESITAVCKSPVGRIYGQLGELSKNEPVDSVDSMKDGLVTIHYDVGNQEAQIIVLVREGEEPFSDRGIRVLSTEEQLTFLIRYPEAVWIYSLFLVPKLLLISSHSNGITGGGAMIKSLKAKCEISIQ